MNDSQVPEYRLVPDFPDYRVGDDGSVWSRRKLGRSKAQTAWRRLRPRPHSQGYQRVSLSGDDGQVDAYIHALVLTAFVGPCPDGEECRHENGKRDDNRLTNLSWGTRQENCQDKVRHGTAPIGEQNPAARLTEDGVRAVRARLALGESVKEIAKSLGMSLGGIKGIRDGINWRHVQ